MTAAAPAIATMADLIPGRYICVQTASPFGAIIRYVTKSKYDHAAVVIPGGRIVEARPTDVRISPISEYKGRLAVVNAGDPMTEAQSATIVDTALSLVGSEYNFATVADQGFAYLGLHWQLLLRLAEHGHCFDCSQLAAYCGKEAGEPWMCGQTVPALVTPAELAARPAAVPLAWT